MQWTSHTGAVEAPTLQQPESHAVSGTAALSCLLHLRTDLQDWLTLYSYSENCCFFHLFMVWWCMVVSVSINSF
jgi:hypothetical protein